MPRRMRCPDSHHLQPRSGLLLFAAELSRVPCILVNNCPFHVSVIVLSGIRSIR